MTRMARRRLAIAALLLACGMIGNAAAEVLTFDEAWRLVLDGHPALVAVAADLEARTADREQAGRAPNPELALEVENFAGSGVFHAFDEADFTLALSQTWERGGKAGGRKAAADAELAVSRTTADLVSLELRSDLARAFVEVLAAQRRFALADTLAQVAAQDQVAVDRRVAAGAEDRIAAQQARLSAAGGRRARDHARQVWQARRQRLGALWNDDQATFARVDGDLDALVPVPGWQALLDELDTSPTARRAVAETNRARAATELARSQGTVDLTTTAGLRHFRGLDENAFVVSVGVPLAVRNTGRDARRAAAADLARAEAEARAATIDLKADLNETRSRLDTSEADVLAMRGEMLPAAAAALDEARRAYARGAYSLTEMLAVRRTWIEWQLAHVDALVSHHLAAIDLAALLGIPAAVPAPATEEAP